MDMNLSGSNPYNGEEAPEEIANPKPYEFTIVRHNRKTGLFF